MTVTGHATASVGSTVVAETDEWEVVEGNVYFPPASLKREFFTANNGLTTVCPWKGTASYYDVAVPGRPELAGAAWYYPSPKEKAAEIKDHVAFYKNKVDVKAEAS